MSGIVNSAGSRSGVIGTTELDYEEGTWTLGTGNMTAVSASFTSNYVKIGNLVTVNVPALSRYSFAVIGKYVSLEIPPNICSNSA